MTYLILFDLFIRQSFIMNFIFIVVFIVVLIAVPIIIPAIVIPPVRIFAAVFIAIRMISQNFCIILSKKTLPKKT